MLQLNNITKVFNISNNAEDAKIVFDNFNLKINDGEFVTIIGGNGSGKSTLMNIISGSLKVDDGTILLNDENITSLKEYQRAKYIGRVFQDPMMGTATNMSILENLEIAICKGKRHRLCWGFKKKHKNIFINELKKFDLGLENRLKQKVGMLSGGQRQALTLIMATLIKPKILLLDEHTAALDPKTAKKVLSFTNQIISENNLTTLMITHNLEDAIKYGNRLIMLDSGKVILDVSGKEKEELSIEKLLTEFKINQEIILNNQFN